MHIERTLLSGTYHPVCAPEAIKSSFYSVQCTYRLYMKDYDLDAKTANIYLFVSIYWSNPTTAPSSFNFYDISGNQGPAVITLKYKPPGGSITSVTKTYSSTVVGYGDTKSRTANIEVKMTDAPISLELLKAGTLFSITMSCGTTFSGGTKFTESKHYCVYENTPRVTEQPFTVAEILGNGAVFLCDDSGSYSPYHCYIYDNGWDPFTPYVYDGGWSPCGGA